MRSIFFIYLFFFYIGTASACQCPITQLSKAECNKYDIIFRGTVLSVATCDNKPGIAIFKIKDLYKGAVTEQFKVIFSCDEDCSYQFKEGEEWIIYSNFKQIDRAKMDWCSRSRRLIKNVKEDYYTATHGNTYDEEYKFLQDSIGIHRLLKEQLTPEQLKNQLPTPNQQIIILICSLLCVILFYYLFNKFFK
jgi:hypothetical protein